MNSSLEFSSRMKAGQLDLLGVNLAGASFGVPSGADEVGTTHFYPSHASIDYFAAKGMDVIRLDAKWERLQPTLNGSLDETEIKYVDDVVAYAASKGIAIVVSLHNYGKYNESLIGTDDVPKSAFADVWSKIATRYAEDDNVIFGLMNEPYQHSASEWTVIANAGIAAIREAGGEQEILVPGSYFSGAHSWISSDNDTTVGAGIIDSKNNFAFEVHQYLDGDSSGSHFDPVSSPHLGQERIMAVTEWAEATGNKLFLGEFAVSADSVSLAALDNMLAYMEEHAAVWQGGTYWAGGEWWGDYPFSIQPLNGEDRPQMAILDDYTSPQATPYWMVSTKVISGTSAQETLNGTFGNDEIQGGGGDTLKGGAGDDTYVVNTADAIVEAVGQGNDTVITWVNNYVLPVNVENLTITGTGWNAATGNALNNRIIGNDHLNLLNGRGGNDILTGGKGNDTFTITRSEGNDTVTDFEAGIGVSDVIKLDGFAFKDFAAVKVAASQINDDIVIDLGGGQTLKLLSMQYGSLTSDDFLLVNIIDVTQSSGNQGMLPNSVPSTNWVYGTAKTETLMGTSGHDSIKSAGGGDTMKGGLGDDSYAISTPSDKAVELAGQGIDTVETWLANYSLSNNVENLIVTGTSWTAGTGNNLDNKMTGNSSPNTLDGRAGNDVLTGGGETDSFIITKNLGHDFITDFEGAGRSGGDTLLLKGFGSGATLSHVGEVWSIKGADGSVTWLTIDNVTNLAVGDYVFA